MSFEALLPDTFTIEAKETGVDDRGGSKTTWNAVTTVKGREVALSGSENQGKNQASIGSRKIMLARLDTSGAAYTLKHENRLRRGTTIYEVLSDALDAAGAGHHFEVPVEVVS